MWSMKVEEEDMRVVGKEGGSGKKKSQPSLCMRRSAKNVLTSIYSRQCQRLLITSLPFSPPAISDASFAFPVSATEPTSDSRIISDKNTGSASSSRKPGISIDICTHDPWPEAAADAEDPSAPSRSVDAVRSFLESCCNVSDARTVFSTSALTPTIAWVPSAKPMRALPFVPGRMSDSAVNGRNCVGERPSGRIGPLGSESEE